MKTLHTYDATYGAGCSLSTCTLESDIHSKQNSIQSFPSWKTDKHDKVLETLPELTHTAESGKTTFEANPPYIWRVTVIHMRQQKEHVVGQNTVKEIK